MFARKFIEHVDTHADQLCEEFMQKIKRSDRCMGLLHRVPLEEQKQSTREIYRNLTGWLLNNTESVTEERYVSLGMRRARQGVRFRDLFWAVCAARAAFWGYMGRETLPAEPADVWGGLHLLNTSDRRFDRALHLTT